MCRMAGGCFDGPALLYGDVGPVASGCPGVGVAVDREGAVFGGGGDHKGRVDTGGDRGTGVGVAGEEIDDFTLCSTTNNAGLADFESNCILEVAILLIKDALSQTANKGVFYNLDLV